MIKIFQFVLLGLIIILSFEISDREEFEGVVPRKLLNGSYILRYTEEAQYLPNLILLHNSLNYDVFFDIVKYSNGDIVIEFIDSYIGSPRIFFGLTANGKYLYGDEIIMSNESFFYIMDDDNSEGGVFVSFIAKDETYNEYMISSTDGYYSYFEIYDFYLKDVTYQYYQNIFNFEKNRGIITFIEIKENDEYYVVVCGNFYNTKDEDIIYFKLMKIKFKQEENLIINHISNSVEEIQVYDNFDCQGCYAIEAEKIICFIYNLNLLIIYIFNYQLVKEGFKELSISNFSPSLFKCIHIKNNIGSIIYLTVEDDNNYLNIQFLDYQGEDVFTNYLSLIKYQIYYNEFNYQSKNFIKISENKVCFIAQNTSFINIYLIYLYEQEQLESNKVVIREYNININSIYNINIYHKLSSIIYNNYIAIGLDYKFLNDDENVYIGLIIFGYANSTDYELDLNYF